MATDADLSGLLGELRAEGELDSRGRFTLDRAQARAKMQKFQLVDARRYVLELVQAAVLRGASELVFAIDADDMRLSFDGASFTAEELGELWASIFADGDDAPLRGLRQLALGLNAALGLGPRRITVRSGTQQLVLRPGADEQLSAIPPVQGTTIHVEQRVRLGLIADFLRNISGRLEEELHLRERCAYASLPVSLDGVAIAQGLKLPWAVVSQEFAAAGLRGVIALLPGDAAASLRLVKDGVWIDSVPLEACGPGLVAVVESERLRKDVSLARIVADEALAEVVRAAQRARWGLMARLVTVTEGTPAKLTRVREEVLRHLPAGGLDELGDLAGALCWPDARTGGSALRWVSLAELAAGGGPLAYALRDHPELVPEGPPIVRVDAQTAGQLARIVGGAPAVCDDELARQSARVLARRAFQRRMMSARLAGEERYLLRAAITAPGLRGQLGLRVGAGDPATPAVGTLWLLREGCLLTRVSLLWGVPALDVVLEGAFTPSELYDDVVPDRALVTAVLQALTALQVPLAGLVEATRGAALAPAMRGLVKAWLSLVLDAEARAPLWEALKVPPALRPDQAAVEAVLPSPARLRAGGGALDVLLQAPLFEDLDGAARSLGELVRRHAQQGRLDEIDRSVTPEPGLGREVAWLGRGDRRILAALLGGESALRSWAPSLAARRREQKFWSLPARTIAELAAGMQADLRAAGLEPGLWSRTLQVGPVEAVIMLAHGSVPPGVEPRLAQIELRHQGRPLVSRALDLGLWPIVGVATSTELQPGPNWDDVRDESAVAAIVAVLSEGAWTLLAGLLARHREALAGWRWVAVPLLLRLAKPDGELFAARFPELTALPLIHTLDGGAISVDQVDAVLREHGRIEWVSPTTADMALGGPPVLRESMPVVTAMRQRFGAESLVDGGERLRRRGRDEQLAARPVVAQARLDPARVWVTASLANGQAGVTGEIGLVREPGAGGLSLVLCTAGREVGAVTVADVAAPVLAILADEELPIDAQGRVDARSKRHGQHLRRCRRAVPGLIQALCRRYPALRAAEQAAARRLLLGYATARLRQVEQGAATADHGLEAVRELPLFADVWGRPRTLAEIEAGGDSVDAVGPEAQAPEAGLELERTILRVDAAAAACLAEALTVRRLDERWAAELAALRELASRPKFELPDLRRVALVERQAAVAGNLQARLWLPRVAGEADALVFTRAGREVGRQALLRALPCAGVVSGKGLLPGEAGALLEPRQAVSLAKQVCGLYEALAKQLRAGRVPVDLRERTLARLVAVDAALEAPEPLLAELGKPLEQLRAALDGLISPAMRRARPSMPVKPAPVAQVKPAPVAQAPVTAAPVAQEPVTPAPVAQEPAPSPIAAVVETPELRLIAALRAELAWARERHGTLLDALGLDRLALGETRGAGIVAFDEVLVIQREHPLVARMLRRLARGDGIDPIELAFVVSAAYTVMNVVAEEIDAEDERAFVARLAESLALGLG